jgi:RNA polymerase sigma-70 factor (ECF subfamily)
MSNPRAATGSDGGRSSATATSRSLLAGARARDAAAWERMVTLYAPLVFHWCGQWGLPPDDTADVFQEVFQSVAAHIGGFRREKAGDTFRGWLRTITRNKVNDYYRRRQHEPGGVGGSEARVLLSQLPDATDDEVRSDDVAENAVLHRALDLVRGEFEPRTWQAFWRTAVEGRAAGDVAAELAMSAGAVRVAKSRVLHRLRAELGDLPG